MALDALSTYLAAKLLNHVTGVEAYAPPAGVWVGLFTSSAGLDGSVSGAWQEVAANGTNGYARQPASFDAAAARESASGAVVTFPTALQDWGNISHVALMDAATGGNVLFWGAAQTAKPVYALDTVSFPAGALLPSFAGAGQPTDFAAHALLDHVLRGEDWAPAGIWLALFRSAAGLAENVPAMWAEFSGGGYARVDLAGKMAASTDGTAQNEAAADFPLATADWGAPDNITHMAVLDAATGGNVLFWCAADRAKRVWAGDAYGVAAGKLTLELA